MYRLIKLFLSMISTFQGKYSKSKVLTTIGGILICSMILYFSTKRKAVSHNPKSMLSSDTSQPGSSNKTLKKKEN